MANHILVIGATLLDTKGKPTSGLEPGTSNPAQIRHVRGGTARNVAENLSRLGVDVILLSAVGDDHRGKQLVNQTEAAGVNTSFVLTAPGHRTGSYIAVLDDDGSLSVAMDDVSVIETITPGHLYRNRRLFRDADLVMMDGSLLPATLETAVRLASQYEVPLCTDPSSVRLVHKLSPYLADLHLLVPNEREAASLSGDDFAGFDPDASLEIALKLRNKGVRTVVITLSDFGLVYATSDETGYLPARYSEMIDSTGTGDAVTAGIILGMLNNLPDLESIRLGAAAASLTLQTEETVVPDLSLDMLYDHLVV